MVSRFILGLVCLPFLVFADRAPALPPLKALVDVTPGAKIFDAASLRDPVVIRSRTKAATYFARDELDKLAKQVDFRRQFVLVFAWRGSGQDRLEHVVMESYPEQIDFQFRPGRTRDLRRHVKTYVLRSNVKWRVSGVGRQPAKPRQSAEYIKVEIQGKLNSQVFAIGGETTGVVISSRGVTLELDFGKNNRLRRKAKQLHEKTVIVTGKMYAKRGVEIGKRLMVAVDTLMTPSADENKKR